jgi:hypothetical protein
VVVEGEKIESKLTGGNRGSLPCSLGASRRLHPFSQGRFSESIHLVRRRALPILATKLNIFFSSPFPLIGDREAESSLEFRVSTNEVRTLNPEVALSKQDLLTCALAARSKNPRTRH